MALRRSLGPNGRARIARLLTRRNRGVHLDRAVQVLTSRQGSIGLVRHGECEAEDRSEDRKDDTHYDQAHHGTPPRGLRLRGTSQSCSISRATRYREHPFCPDARPGGCPGPRPRPNAESLTGCSDPQCEWAGGCRARPGPQYTRVRFPGRYPAPRCLWAGPAGTRPQRTQPPRQRERPNNGPDTHSTLYTDPPRVLREPGLRLTVPAWPARNCDSWNCLRQGSVAEEVPLAGVEWSKLEGDERRP